MITIHSASAGPSQKQFSYEARRKTPISKNGAETDKKLQTTMF